VSRHEQSIRVPILERALVYEVLFDVPIRFLFPGLFERVRKDITRRARILLKRKHIRNSRQAAWLRMLAAQGPMRFLDFRVLAIDITSNGFAYIVLEGSERLVEWQLVYISPNTISAYLLRLRKIISQYSPEVLVLQEPKRAHHDSRSREILEKFKLQGRQCGLKTFCI